LRFCGGRQSRPPQTPSSHPPPLARRRRRAGKGMGQGGEGSGGILTPVKSVNQFPHNTITMENRESGQFIHMKREGKLALSLPHSKAKRRSLVIDTDVTAQAVHIRGYIGVPGVYNRHNIHTSSVCYHHCPISTITNRSPFRK
jgi:hypothetical protein